MGLSKKQREERRSFVKKLLDEGYSTRLIMRKYDYKFGTHYFARAFPLLAKVEMQ